MKLSELRTFARISVSTLKGSKFDDTYLDLLIKAGVRLTSQMVECLTKTSYFNSLADIGEYKISENISDYCSIQESGIWWNIGTVSVPQWKQLQPVTKAFLDIETPSWRDADSSTPDMYYIEGDIIGVHPKPDSALTNGFRLDHYRMPAEMTSDDQYPYEGATKIPHLEILDECIIAYVKWKASPIVGEEQQENPYEAEFCVK